jgi:hypothetical protein
VWDEDWGHMQKDPWHLDAPWSYITWPADERALAAEQGAPGLERERGKEPRAEGEDDPLRVELVHALGNFGVGGEALMDPDVGLVPQRSGEPPFLCAWQTVAAAAKASATRLGDAMSCENVVRTRRSSQKGGGGGVREEGERRREIGRETSGTRERQGREGGREGRDL